ncbi:response regulator [Agrobacterium vitis]|uniref:Response regulator n=1 Tax=Agrobacterium vitis TaxID=373 RepID=A0A109CX62_AGRVI|nr:response regulator [Agrobacterium vitis]KAA3506235.1 response regulator [Agrobacterium vitis]KAA3520664.1 response regulator [Agrobacterium vitis]MBF2712956.1 response regulator [Agrobacterium vitis]MCF1480148.1 response regulator [Agrobacterium vitis]MUO98051.1 response regulator [Agrobacterium vitis]
MGYNGITVLVVEDEVLIRMGIVESLQEEGFEVLEASNADDAIAVLNSHSEIRLMFTDINMPGSMDGLKLATAVRDRWPPVKIIVTSGHLHIREDALPVVGRFFSKPYDSTLVVRAIRDML